MRYKRKKKEELRPLAYIAYVKACLRGDEPADVAGYADLHPSFPHESTGDQWFSESQFESYRRLGEVSITSAIARYNSAKSAYLPQDKKGGNESNKAVPIVEKLRESATIEDRDDLIPTHAGVIVGWPKKGEWEFLLVKALGSGYVLPKGHIEPGESEGDTARRELREETGYLLARIMQEP